jgi:hypothetical protein
MSDRDFGSLHKYLDPEEKSFETVVFQQNTALSSSEQVLSQELRRQEEDSLIRNNINSGWISGSFLSGNKDEFSFGTSANQFKLTGKPIFHINGWIAPLEYTNTSNDGENVVNLDSPPSSGGELGVDFVFLEAWRALVKADPDSTNKPASDKLYRHGNVLSPSGTWLNDDLKDNPISQNINEELSIRIQIQYRLRSVRLNTDSNRDGYSDDAVEVQGPNSNPQSNIHFTHAPSFSGKGFSDRGLWIGGGEIGSGNEIAGTADGFVYSIPICLVYRRNSAGWDAMNNGNGGINDVESNVDSDRPDDLFSDQVVEDDIQDIRHGVNLTGQDWDEVIQKNTSLLLDSDLKTWAATSAHTPWYVGGNNDSAGTKMFMADDLVPSGVDNSSGNTIRNPDGVCRVFSDRTHVQKYVEVYTTNSDWGAGDQLELDFTSSGKDVKSEMPDGTIIGDVNSVVLNDTDGSNGQLEMPVQKVEGLETLQSTITIDPGSISSQADIWVEWEVIYPPGEGLSSHPRERPSNFEMYFHDPSTWDTTIGTTMSSSSDVLSYMDISYGEMHREAEIEFRTDSNKTETIFAKDSSTVALPEYPYLDGNDPNNTITVNDNGSTKTISGVEGRVITITGTFSSSDAQVDVTYTPHKALPSNGAEMTVYYRAPGIQAISEEFLPDPLEIEPVYMPEKIYSVVTGVGSQEECYPWRYPSSQIPVSEDASYAGEEELSSPSKISVDDFDSETGMLELSTMVPMPSVSSITLQTLSSLSSSSSHDEWIDHYKEVDPSGYKPSVFSQPLSGKTEHKTFYPILARLKQDTDFAKKGTVVMIVFSHYHDYLSNTSENIEENKIVFNNENSCASVYKVQGNFLD